MRLLTAALVLWLGALLAPASALAHAEVQKFVAGQAVKKIVIVPGRLVNIVI